MATGLLLINGTTQTITTAFTTNGSAGNLAKMWSTSAGSAASLTKTTAGVVEVDYMSIKDNTPVQTSKWYAGVNSTLVSNTGNWLNTAAPVTHTTTGVLTGAGSAIAGSASSATGRASSGVLTGSGSAVAGAANRFRAMSSTGVLAGGGASVAGSALLLKTHETTGSLAGGSSTIVGAADSKTIRPSSGILAGGTATIAGAASRRYEHYTTGVVRGAGSRITGFAYPGVLNAGGNMQPTMLRVVRSVIHPVIGDIQ
jgi:hypothetical protein